MEPLDFKEITPEQKKEIAKILSKARWSLFLITIKFSIGLFSANALSLFIGAQFFTDPETFSGFFTICLITNFIFMSIYLARQIKGRSDMLTTEIKEALKNKTE